MLPIFPIFKKIEVSDKEDVEKITSQFAPYSDFNFLSMWSWDTAGLLQISTLNDNLVVKFIDYVTKEPFYSFIGKNKVDDTAETLLRFAQSESITPKLSLVPEEIIAGLDTNKFVVEEQRDHFDYIYPVNEIITYSGSKQKKHREVLRSFERKHKYTTKKLDLTDKPNHKLLINLVDKWIQNKINRSEINKLDLDDFQNEYMAIEKVLSAPTDLLKSVVCFSVFVDDELSGFMIDEKVSKDYCISHFGKINKSHSGNMQIMMQNSAKTFSEMGVKYYNDEQDLGLDYLRSAKGSYHLDHFLKKYSVSLS